MPKTIQKRQFDGRGQARDCKQSSAFLKYREKYYKEFKDKCEEYLKTFNEIRYYEENNSTKRNIMASKLSSLYVGRKLEDFKKVYEIACKELEDETHQAMEALVHNFNTLVYIGAA